MPRYMTGFGNSFETEALPGALPIGRNSPQRPAYGLYAEQLSGTPFTAPRDQNRRSWLYRIMPSVRHGGRFRRLEPGLVRTAPERADTDLPIGPQRWDPIPIEGKGQTFVTGLRTITVAGDAGTHAGMATHVAIVTRSMADAYFRNDDGELLIVAQEGALRFRTEFGIIDIAPGAVAVIPRGMVFLVELPDGPARAYVCENYGGPFTLPERGPIGANCLANPRDFEVPVAAFEDRAAAGTLTVKWGGAFHEAALTHSPLDVVAWHGNYAPYRYDLERFAPVGAIGFDHPDPSIFTTLTSPSGVPGTANVDFVIFPPRWAVAEDTFRPPWYHRNIMSEFMGLIRGVYDAKAEGFVPGGISLHTMMQPHGPDAAAFEQASTATLAPAKIEGSLAFMFETCLPQRITAYAAGSAQRQPGYEACWTPLKRTFRL